MEGIGSILWLVIIGVFFYLMMKRGGCCGGGGHGHGGSETGDREEHRHEKD